MKLSSTIIWRIFDHLCNAQWAYYVFDFMNIYPEILHEYAMNKYVYYDDTESICNLRQTLEYALKNTEKIMIYYVKGYHIDTDTGYHIDARYHQQDSESYSDDELDWITVEESEQIINDINNLNFLIIIARPKNSWANRAGDEAEYSDYREYYNGKMIHHKYHSNGWNDNGCPTTRDFISHYDGNGKLIYQFKNSWG